MMNKEEVKQVIAKLIRRSVDAPNGAEAFAFINAANQLTYMLRGHAPAAPADELFAP